MDAVLKVDFDRLCLDDLVAIEEGDKSARFIRSILGRFLVNPETNEYYPTEEAGAKAAGKLSVRASEKAVAEFTSQVQALKEAKIPPISGGN